MSAIIKRRPGFWLNCSYEVLSRYVQECTTDLDDYLMQAGYAATTRTTYINLVRAAIKKMDIRDLDQYREYCEQFVDKSRYGRMTARARFMDFCAFNTGNMENQSRVNNNVVRATWVDREIERYKRKVELYKKSRMDILEGIERQLIRTTLDEIDADAYKMFKIRERFAKKQFTPGEQAVIVPRMNDLFDTEEMGTAGSAIQDPDVDSLVQDNPMTLAVEEALQGLEPDVNSIREAVVDKLHRALGIEKDYLMQLQSDDPDAFEKLSRLIS